MYLLTLVSPISMPSLQFAVDTRNSPKGVLATHSTNQVADILRNARTPWLPISNLPGPEQTKALAPPAADHGGFYDIDFRLPVLPGGTGLCPQESIIRGYFWPLHRTLKDADLVAQRADLS
jgi:hypothetical protein